MTPRRTTFHSGAHLIFKVYDQSTMDNNFNSATTKTRICILEIMEKNIKHYLQAKCSANLSSVSTVDAWISHCSRTRMDEKLTSLYSRNVLLSASSNREPLMLPRHTLNMPTFLRWSSEGSLTSAMCSQRLWECAAIQSVSRTLSPMMDELCCGNLEGTPIRQNTKMKRISDAVDANAT